MANTVTKTAIQNSLKSLILHIYLESDGNEGELTNYVLIDPNLDFAEPNTKGLNLTLAQAWFSFSWFDALLSFDSLVPLPAWELARDANNYMDFRYFGGISNRYIDPQNIYGSDKTGKILISTKDFAPLGSNGTLVLEFRKTRNNVNS